MKYDIDTWEEIFLTITRNKTRSLLTAFGVFWGIFMLIALIGGGNGMQDMERLWRADRGVDLRIRSGL